MNKLLKLFGILTSFGMLLVLLMGAVVTKTGSGDGCGNSWPLCYGKVLPEAPEIETIIEVSHRIVSAALGLLVIILAIWTWRKIGHLRETKFLAIASVFLIVFQGLLGAAAVVWGQSDIILASHFGFSLASFASVVLLTILVFEASGNQKTPHVPKRIRIHLYAITIYSYIVVYTGALVRHTGASMACENVPFCSDGQLFAVTGPQGIQMLHRTAAIFIFIWLLYILIIGLKEFKSKGTMRTGLIVSFVFVSLQALSGMLVVVSNLNLFLALFHGLFISGLFTVLLYLVMLSLRSGRQ
ncbi:COX15/CtaA family protein [Bacillus sp. es.036]|uniref:COX15/CtaA family protein n=1 Tax=Bacillus sp. es.036 TaxID=1761764 RepID=UPI000C00CBB0|nr:heme A synthase [Bacillus sp. es.036]PFG12833.1 cytochrome c oxidase assembly protein subunit 15 [Bacillus sp. es.036]